ncbi:hypothetical protein FZX09_09680 [Synechococcus sp. MU1643]|uniref:hypothetical protein n=1 Tax=Synechococcus sp. MU1643 TaxID=2508349 RepID=UPI001CF8CC36|nr:hypothetical protein [Synechococcus sp. MU1643]MCB4429048.1 hypothetical protein [Synechococcus sp. MU1643]
MRRLRLLWGVGLLLGACAAPKEPPSWRLFPLQRYSPHDGVAVVNQPDGYGLHIYLETDTSFQGVCRPRWLPDPARLFNGNGSTPFSSGLAARQEFFDAVARRDVRGLLKKELKALCQDRAPDDRWQWTEPPRNDNQVVPVQLPSLEEEDLLTNPVEELKRARQLLRDQRAGE